MDEEYDAIVLGTGLKECVLSGLLSMQGKKVLHMDRNSYYGGESASLNLNQFWAKFRPGEEVPAALGPSRDWNIDLIPKFLMASGLLVKMLLKTQVTRYLEFKSVDGSYVFRDGRVYKVPASDTEALKSSLMGIFEKRRCRKFFLYVQDFEADKPQTWQGVDLNRVSMREVFNRYGLDANTIDFIGHAIALHLTDDYLDQPALETVKRIQLYFYSLARYLSSPYIYPVWGLGGLPEGFSRMSAIHGGVYMLNKPIEEIVFDEEGKVCGVRSEGETARTKMLICDPSYLLNTNKVQRTGSVVRAICILSHPLPNTDGSHSCQIILPQKQLGRAHDVYVFFVSFAHKVAANGRYIAIASTDVETKDPERELDPALALMGPIDYVFYSVSDTYKPAADGRSDNVFVTESYDATSHFESSVDDILSVYKRIFGHDLDLQIQQEVEVEEK